MDYIRLKNFKCFRDRTVKLNRLTVLAGSNNIGKSSVIQSLVILHNAIHNEGYVDLNHTLGVTLGYDTSLLNTHTDESDIVLEYGNTESGETVTQTFTVGTTQSTTLRAKDMAAMKEVPEEMRNRELYYLCAERIGPRLSMPDGALPYNNVGIRGEFTGQVLNENDRTIKVDPERLKPGTTDPFLKSQTNAWLSTIIPDLEVSGTEQLGLHTLISVKSRKSSDEFYATNVGFGFSYILPIIVSGLIAETGRYLVIENPEVHLHPAAQVALARFLFRMSQAGLNVVIETHSDHILEGIQLEVAANPGWAENVTINTFSPVDDDQPEVEEITFDKYANFSHWPDGFMDQSQKDYSELVRLRNESK